MSPFQAAVLSCRILALYVLYQALSVIAGLPMALASLSFQRQVMGGVIQQQNQQNSRILFAYSGSTLLHLLLFGLFAAFLWFGASRLAGRIAAASGDDAALSPAISPSGSHVQRILLTMIGVLVLAFAIPEAGQAVTLALMASADPSPNNASQLIAGNWKLLLQFVIGVSLLFGAPAISRLFDKWNSAETKALPQSIQR